jgi:2-keto-3-deoxy-L-rhamnonate aldolase RhmA
MIRKMFLGAALCAAVALAQSPRIYNTVKTKLAAGKQVIGGTVSSSDPDIYCAVANAGFDFTWIEMQHSPLNFHEVAIMLKACRGAAAIPFIRVPDATEGDIQKAMDIGALGIIIPMVESVEKVKNAIKWANYPPIGKRSLGGGQYGLLWGSDYRQTANANLAIVAMVESPAGVEIADQIAAIPGVDAVFVASTDLGSFSGFKQGEPQYEALVSKTRDAVLKAKRAVGGPVAWKERPGYHFFQAPGETTLIRLGADKVLGGAAEPGMKKGVAPIEGSEHTESKKK